jgi:hypothetical protein
MGALARPICSQNRMLVGGLGEVRTAVGFAPPRPEELPMRKVVTAVLVAAAAFGATACSQAVERVAEKAIEEQTGGNADVDITKDGAKIQTKDGSASINTGELPADFPKDVPIPKGAKVVAGSSGGKSDPVGASAALTTTEKPDDVAKFYKAKLPAEGWTVDENASAAAGGVSGAESVIANKDGRTLSVVVATSPATSETSIILTVGKS